MPEDVRSRVSERPGAGSPQLADAISAIHLRYGGQALAKGSQVPAPQPWPTGIGAVDRLSGLGGLPQGRLSVIQGHTGSGKLSLALALLASATQQLAHAIVIDPHRRFDPWALLPFGPELRTLTVARPAGPGAAAEAAISLARAGAAFILVFLWDGEGASQNWLGALEAAAQRSGSIVVWATESVPSALAHGSSFSLQLARRDWVWERGQLIGMTSQVRCVKNKVSAIAGMAAAEVATELLVKYPVGAELFPELPVAEVPDRSFEEAPWVARSAAG